MQPEILRNKLVQKVIDTSLRNQFDDELAMEIFSYQFHHNPLYNQFCNLLHRTPENVFTVTEIPFLPISFFKTHSVICQSMPAMTVFKSSGTTGMERSHHLVADLNLYEQCAINGFERFYGSLNEFVILALLPSYIEQGESSLVFMTSLFVDKTKNPLSGFLLGKNAEVKDRISKAMNNNEKVILIGVTYALLDLVDRLPEHFGNNLIIMETGGMKGRRKEMVKSELHRYLSQKTGVEKIHSEFGMTELLSQAYSKGNGIFLPSNTMKIIVRDMNDPLSIEKTGKTGGINVIDLANIDSCSFIATQDLGKYYHDGSFEILGRFDQSDIRGCNLLVEM